MIDPLLHTGLEHPSLAWIVVPSILTFLAGLWLGATSGRVRTLLGVGQTDPTD